MAFKLWSKSAFKRITITAIALIILVVALMSCMTSMPGDPLDGSEKAVIESTMRQQHVADMLYNDLYTLTVDIGERNTTYRYENLVKAKNFIKDRFSEMGYKPTEQVYQVDKLDCANVVAEKTGTTLPDEIIVIGGHYDSVVDCPGANDNGTGTVATLALADIFSKKEVKRTIRFVGFVNEEPPHFWTVNMGSLVYARECKRNKDNIIGMISLETMGSFYEEPKSQSYPPPLNLMYPDTGNFIAFVGNMSSRAWLHEVIEPFRKYSDIPSEGCAAISALPGIGWSDQWAFWQEGYPGIMITDTAPFRYKYYHTSNDTIDKVDFEKFPKIVNTLAQVIEDIANK